MANFITQNTSTKQHEQTLKTIAFTMSSNLLLPPGTLQDIPGCILGHPSEVEQMQTSWKTSCPPPP